MSKKITLFDYLNTLFTKKKVNYDKKIASCYLISLWLSHEKDLIDIVNEANEYLFELPDKAIFQYYMDKIPKGSTRYIQFTKKKKVIEEKEKEIKYLMDEYDISEREAILCLT